MNARTFEREWERRNRGMDTAGVRVEIISLCIFTELQLIDTVLLRLLKLKMATAFDHMVRFS